MKKLALSIICICMLHIAWGQAGNSGALTAPVFTLLSGQIVYPDTVSLDAAYTKDRLFANAHEWYRKNFQTSDNILTVDNTADGMISGTGIIHYKNKKNEKADPGDISFAIDIHIQNNSYSYRVYGILGIESGARFSYSDMNYEEHYPLAKTRWTKEYRERMLTYMDTQITDMLARFTENMKK